MHRSIARRAVAFLAAVSLLSSLAAFASAENARPAVGDMAPDFRLLTLAGEPVELAKLRAEGPVVLVMLRGYPGYQCPICSRQVGELLANASKFAERGARIVLVYPGAASGLAERAAEFIRGSTLPDNVDFVVDPDYSLTNAYHLRWDAPRETAYPAALVVDRQGKIAFAKISDSHGGRATAQELLQALGAQ